MLSTLPNFCFPDGIRLLTEKPRDGKATFFSFVLTTAGALRLHVSCLKLHERISRAGEHRGLYDIYAPKCVCLFSQLPFLETFRHVLADLVWAARSNRESASTTLARAPAYARRLVAQLFYEAPLPRDHTTQVIFSA